MNQNSEFTYKSHLCNVTMNEMNNVELYIVGKI